MFLYSNTISSSYGLYEWNRAQDALKLKGKTINELSILFDQIDSNKSGSIDLNELEDALKKYGDNSKFSKSQIRAMMNKADIDHDGQISREEFMKICEELHTTTHIPYFPALYLPNLIEQIKKQK